MVLFNYSTKELTAKVVYYGPGLCGKTTNLQWIHEKVPITNKGKMLSLATETDRTLFFDFLPIELGTIRGMRTRIQLYTVPGQVFYNATRRMVLKGADCVVFCCDSQEPMLEANVESFENMRQNLEANEIDPEEIPLVFQYNKRDLPNALPIEILNERMNPRGRPFFEAIAVKGVGVEETLKGVVTMVFRSLAGKYGGQETTPAPAPDNTPSQPIKPAVSAARLMGATATLPPVTGSRPVKAPPATPPPPVPILEEDLLDELDFGPPPTPPPPPPRKPAAAPPPPLAVAPEKPLTPEDDHAPLMMDEAELDFSRAEVGDSPLDPPAARRLPAPVSDRDTLVSPPEEAEEIRRQIRPAALPEISLDEIEEEDEEEIEEISLDSAPPWAAAREEAFDMDLTPAPSSGAARPPPSGARPAPAPSATVAPVSVDLRRGPTEVTIPLDVVLENGSGPVRLDLRLTLNLNVKTSS